MMHVVGLNKTVHHNQCSQNILFVYQEVGEMIR